MLPYYTDLVLVLFHDFFKVWFVAFAFIIAQVRKFPLLPSSEMLMSLTDRARVTPVYLI